MSACDVDLLARAARAAQPSVAALDGPARSNLIRAIAARLRASGPDIIAANAEDVARATDDGCGAALRDRLNLDGGRLEAIARSLEQIAAQPEVVGQVTRREVRPNGLRVERQRIPLGVIAMIYEARPNVTAEAAALCLKSGNAVILRGGSEARKSNAAIAGSIEAAMRDAGLPPAAVGVITDPDREHVLTLLKLENVVDLVIPRGGEGLIRFVSEHARVPVIKHYRGVCHLYVDASADLDVALALLLDGKTSRPAVCNAIETLLVHAAIAPAFLPLALAALHARGVEVRGCSRTRDYAPAVKEATADDYAAEFLDLILAVRVVADLDSALAHIERFGSNHTEVIATGDEVAASRFVAGTHSAAVMVNASSRFNDGGELGLGAEIGISTMRLHAYGPMGAESLTIERFVVSGIGQVRSQL